ncbi:MAG: hypothetical protein IPQ26_03035 [Elusimicrobia bacterium]|nr:hypothetical protein [Elusimicrobiota bacterium]
MRNNIEHYKFEMDIAEVRRTLGRLIQATNEFNTKFNLIDLKTHIDPDCLKTFETLADEYRANLAHARAEALEESESGEAFDCTQCGESKTAYCYKDKYICKFCNESESIVQCFRCEDQYPKSEVRVWNDDHLPGIDYICEGCESYFSSQ